MSELYLTALQNYTLSSVGKKETFSSLIDQFCLCYITDTVIIYTGELLQSFQEV